MGTHPSGPAMVTSEGGNQSIAGRTLASVLKEVPEYSGSIRSIKEFGADLPFLFKVLSIEQPLSIQSHPDKELAKKLHASDPKNYPDGNHKPEMAIALNPMDVLCSFRPRSQILNLFDFFPFLCAVVSTSSLKEYTLATTPEDEKNALRDMFSNVLKADPALVSETISRLEHELKPNPGFKSDFLSEISLLFNKVHPFYPNDVGCICALFLNFIRLSQGDAILLKANEPHAYLSGDCIEVMAKSDNVIRAGFTPKFKDVEQLYQSLSYKSVSSSDLVVRPVDRPDGFTSSYLTPQDMKEFSVDRIYFNSEMASNTEGALCKEVVLPAKESGSILIVIRGDFYIKTLNIKAKQGCVYFIPAMMSVTVVSSQSELLCFRSSANL